MRKKILFLMMAFLLTACVRHVESRFPLVPFDRQKAIDSSVLAANEYLRVGNAAAAKRHLDQALKVDPKSPAVHNGLALVYGLTGDQALAEEQFKKALNYDRHYALAHNNYGTFLYQHQRYEEALSEFQQAAENPDYTQRYLAYENMGRSALKLKNVELAKRAFLKVIQLDGQRPGPYLELAEVSLSEGLFRQAQNYLQAYGHLTRNTPRSLWLGIQVARALNDQNALASYELALKNLYPKSPEYQRYMESLK